MIKLLAIPLLLFSLASNVAETEEIAKAISDNISSEYVSCAAYFSLVSNAVARPNEPELSQKYKKMYEISMQGALDFAKSTRDGNMARKVTLARFENYLKSMSEEIDNDFSNISILFSGHSTTCKTALEQPEVFMNDIKDRTMKNYKTNDANK